MAPATPNKSKKRKASELDGESPLNGTHRGKTPKQSAKRQEQNTELADGSPNFRVYCPADQDDPKQQDAFHREVLLAEDFRWKYRVEPKRWGDIKPYKNVKLQEQTFSIGDIIYVNRQDIPPGSPSENLTDKQLLEYDQKNFWVGKIIQARADSDKAVHILIAWLYWPDELPKGLRKSYHADGELILSNAMDIIDATTISSLADIVHWPEFGDDEETLQQTPDRFWRQTFNAGGYDTHSKADQSHLLSSLRTYCKCKKQQNPSKRMFHCSNASCKTWNHEECLVEEIGRNALDAYENGKIDDFATEHELSKTLGQRALQPVKAFVKKIEAKIEHALEDGIEVVKEETAVKLENGAAHGNGNGTPTASTVAANRKRPRNAAWEQKLSISLKNSDADKPFVAVIKEKTGKRRSWEIKVDCLVCGKAMD